MQKFLLFCFSLFRYGHNVDSQLIEAEWREYASPN